jgi:RNase adapter protein RapZ
MANRKVLSFSYRDNEVPNDAGLVLDCRPMRNPHHDPRFRPLTGLSQDVQDFVMCDPKFKALFDDALRASIDGDKVAFGCYGGRHRSVAMAELLAKELGKLGHSAKVEHLALS